MTAPDPVADYYNRNTRRFLRYGGSRESAAIHRRIWAPGVENSEQAFLYLNRLVAETIQPLLDNADHPIRVLDLGCGVGGSAAWLVQQINVSVTGVANSQVQVEIARQRAEQLGLQDRCHFLLADFMEMPPLGPFLAAWAIESFIHAPSPQRFFEQAHAQLIPGGRLLICDDFLSPDLPSDRNADRWVRRFQQGWRVPNLIPSDQAIDLARSAGFRLLERRDLTRWLHGFHPFVLWLVAAVTRIPLPSAYWQNLAGGAALQICIRNGWTRYQALIFEKPLESAVRLKPQ